MFGRVLIYIGLLMFLFVAYQLWGTALEYAQAQSRLDDQLKESLVAAPTAPAAASLPIVEDGDAVARIEIPSIGLDAAVVAGVAADDLKKGPGHYPGTPMPGQLGNAAIAGHRTTYGQPFFRLDEIAIGQEIIITTAQGRYVYRMSGRQVVQAENGEVLATTDPQVARLTLTTCHPRYSAAERLVVDADLDVLASSPPQTAVLNHGRTTGAAAAADSTDTSSPTRIQPVMPSNETVDVAGEAADAFSDGWFDDDEAFAQIALWGTVLTAISVCSARLSRWAGHKSVGALVGAVPFVIALYFVFQNVNRLLPAAI